MLYFISHTSDPLSGIRAALRGGCRWIQLRLKDVDTATRVALAREILPEIEAAGARLIIDDDIEAVLRSGAHGVHLGQNDTPIEEAVRQLPGKIVGATANTASQIVRAVRAGASYIGLGPFRWTDTKKGLSPILGIEGVREVISQARETLGCNLPPIFVIGGITSDDIPAIIDAGANGIAVSGSILRADDPETQTAKLLKLLNLRYMNTSTDILHLGGRDFHSRLFVGTGKFSSNELMAQAIKASGTEMVTLAMKRIDMSNPEDDMLRHISAEHIQLLPNTSGVRDAREAVLAAQLAREAFGTDFIKLEIHPDPKYLFPDPIETLKATEELVRLGFKVLPYIQADPVLCKRLEEVGTAAVMPLAAPIGTNKGLVTRDLLEIIIAESRVPVVVDAGLGAPSHAAAAMELGADAVLVNTAIAVAGDPVAMARAFAKATEAGREAYLAGLGATSSHASATSPLTSFLDL